MSNTTEKTEPDMKSIPMATLLEEEYHQEKWEEEYEPLRTEIPERKRSGFDRKAFVADLKRGPSKNSRPHHNQVLGGVKSSIPVGLPILSSRREAATSIKKGRSHIRGVRHRTPFKLYMGALFTLFFILSIIATIYLIVSASLFLEIGTEGYIILSSLLFSTLLFLSVSRSCKCAVCKAAFFSLKKINKHERAHHVPGCGHTFSTALHSILFFWSRCPVCGTPNRIIPPLKGKY